MRKRIPAAVTLVIGGLVWFASPVWAHVTVDPGQAPKGSYTKLIFRVPSEMALANTVKFDVKFDENHPIPTVAIKPKAGWTPNVITRPLRAPIQTGDGDVTDAVSQITWAGGTIAPGQFDEFEVAVGPLPADVEVLLFPAVQTYSDGTEVTWNQQSFAGQPEPDHPAPVLKLTAATGTAKPASSGDGSSTLAAVALVIGAAGLGIGSWAWWNVRRWR
jgi:uncharacterized protein YcnI